MDSYYIPVFYPCEEDRPLETHWSNVCDNDKQELTESNNTNELLYNNSSRLAICQLFEDDNSVTFSLNSDDDTNDDTNDGMDDDTNDDTNNRTNMADVATFNETYAQTPKNLKNLKNLKNQKIRKISTFETAGITEIEYAVSYFFKHVPICKSLIIRATDIFKTVAKVQNDQKRMIVRKRHSRQKAFVISSIIVGMRQLGLNISNPLTNTKLSRDKQNIEELNRVVPGEIVITINCVKKCCRELGFGSLKLS